LRNRDRARYRWHVPSVRIPRTAVSRRERTYAQLIQRVHYTSQWKPFDGPLLRCGSVIDEAELWPAQDFPDVPLLLEYAGNDRSGRGHNRSNSIYILWRYDRDRNAFVEVMRCVSKNAGWIDQVRAVAIIELKVGFERDPEMASKVSARIIIVLDRELDLLDQEDRGLVMIFVYEQFAARASQAHV
jgi:hypothetical protein